MVTLTEPSMAFSMGAKPMSTSPDSTAASTSGIDGQGHHLAGHQVGLGVAAPAR